MKTLLLLAAPMALLLPVTAGAGGVSPGFRMPTVEQASASGSWESLVEDFRRQSVQQVRIEERVIIRIAPRSPSSARSSISTLSSMAPVAPVAAPRFSERKVGKCVAMAGIGGFRVNGNNQLLLFMRDQRLISATLEKACSSRDFYSGFYVDRTSDGMLCVDRDQLRSRVGSNCSLSKLRQLVEEDD